jgi:uncharacterized membrane protein YcaP (DUF421 family)
MEFLNQWWGINENITPLEISERSAVMFLIALILIRISGMRPFGKGNGVDTIITFLIGAILSRGIVGATPFFSTVISVIVILIIHKIMTKFSLFNPEIEKVIKGESYLLYSQKEFNHDNMRKANVSKKDIYEELRIQTNASTLDKVSEIYMERTGGLSFITIE